MFNISTNGIVRTVLVSSFLLALLIGAGGAYFILHDRAVQRTAAEAGRLLSVATAVRGYTEQHIAPLLRSDDKLFHAETVPAFAAQTVYRSVQGNYPGVFRAMVNQGARVRWSDLRMTLDGTPEVHPARGVLLSNWEI